jgi:hypothetical protein
VKNYIKLGLFIFLVLGSFGSAFAQLTTTSVEPAPNYDSFVPPAVGGTYVDPVFGSTIKRVSNAMGTVNASGGGNLTWIENEYATMSPFNSDNSLFILVHESYFGLYNGTTGAFIQNLPLEISASSEPRWSRKDNVTLYYHIFGGNQLKSYNTSTGVTSVIHTFSQYSSISGNGESDISLDGDHFVFAGDNAFIFVYQISTDKVYTALNAGSNGFDSMYITPSNNVIVSWLTNGTTRFTGQELFDINMNFQRQVGHADGHKDVTSDTNGNEVLIWTNSADPQPIANCNNGIVKIQLSNGAQTCLLQLDWSLAVHISAPDGNGTVFVDTEAPANPESGSSGWVAYTDEILQVKLDGSGTTRWAQHRSRPLNSYNWEPKISTSRDGTRLLYASDYNLQTIDGYTSNYGDTYLIATNLPASQPSPGAPKSPSSPTTPTTKVVRYEQNNAAVTYTGTWYPNGGSFNSGGSATLSMAANSTAVFSFTGTGVNWIGYSDAWSGIAQVYLDGAFKATVDTYAATEAAQKVQYSLSNLTNAAHTLTIVVTGTQDSTSAEPWVWVDAFDVTTVTSTPAPAPAPTPTPAPTPAATPVLIQQNNSAVTYAGTWYPNTNSIMSGGSAVLAMDANASATVAFNGTGITWIGYQDQWSGIANVYVDGKLQTPAVDTYAAAQKAQSAVFSITGLSEGAHTLKIVATGNHDTASAGSWVWVDAFQINP